ncbi:MAG: hypothetical protein EOM05_04345 [Clostridia bacterium]|nr:hypothetical protein [Clostridia bacterium]
MSSDSNIKLRHAVNYFLSFLMSLILAFSATFITLDLTVLNRNFILKETITKEYTDGIYKDFMFKMEAISTPNYISKECYNNIFTKDKIKQDISTYFTKTLKTGKQYDLLSDTQKMQKQLRANIVAEFEKENIAVTDEISKYIDSFVNEAFTYYVNYISMEYISIYVELCEKIQPIINTTLIIAVVMLGVIIVMFYKLSYYKHHSLNYIIYALIASALMTSIAPFYLCITGVHKRLNIRPDYVLNVIVNMFNTIEYSLFAASLLQLAEGIILIFVVNKMRRKYISVQKSDRVLGEDFS